MRDAADPLKRLYTKNKRGLSELERRQNEAVVRQSRFVGFISLGIAILALAISVEGSMSSTKWEKQQLALLETISKNVDIAPIVTQQTSMLGKIGTQLDTGMTCILKGEPVKVGAEKQKTPGK